MSLEMQPSPVTGFRRRNDDDSRDPVRADTAGDDREQDEEVVEDDKDDIGDN